MKTGAQGCPNPLVGQWSSLDIDFKHIMLPICSNFKAKIGQRFIWYAKGTNQSKTLNTVLLFSSTSGSNN